MNSYSILFRLCYLETPRCICKCYKHHRISSKQTHKENKHFQQLDYLCSSKRVCWYFNQVSTLFLQKLNKYWTQDYKATGLNMSVIPVSYLLSVSTQSFINCFLGRKLYVGLPSISSSVVRDEGDPILHYIQTWSEDSGFYFSNLSYIQKVTVSVFNCDLYQPQVTKG